MRSLIRYSLLNIGAFGINAGSQLAIVPLVVGGYGVAALGALALLRLLLPTGLLGLLCPGLQTAAVRLAAGARPDGQATGPAVRALGYAFLLALATGVLVGGALLLPDPATLPGLLEATPEETGEVVALLPAFAAVLPLLFVGLVAQGLLTGLQRFVLLRLLDVAATTGLLALVLAAVVLDLAFHWVLSGFVALQGGKALLFTFQALRHLRRLGQLGRGAAPAAGGSGAALLWRELRTLAPSQIVGGGTNFLPPMMVLWVGGAPLLGLYDALRRIPMAIKQLNGLVRTTVLPAAVAIGASPRYRRALAERGSFVVGICVAPLTLHLGIFGVPLLTLWLGPDYAAQGWVFLLFMLELTVQELQGVLSSAAGADLRLVRRETRVRAIHLLLLLGGLAILLRPDDLLPAAALMLALALAARGALSLAFLPHFGLSPGAWLRSQAKMIAIPAAVAALAYWASAGLSPELRLLLVAPAGLLLSLLLSVLAAAPEERVAVKQLLQEARGLTRRSRPDPA